MTKNELKLCPFCGGDAMLNYDPNGVKDTFGRDWGYTIVCTKCAASSRYSYSTERISESWNNRVYDEADALNTIDSADVIRCSDCEHYGESPYHHPTIGWCIIHGCHKKPDYFCADADRRIEE